ncbi:MAG: hypothetical protein K1X39_00925 [Thermoflexales bacterium]|nr:hypothetical protein [Thermoflexales bacterium]
MPQLITPNSRGGRPQPGGAQVLDVGKRPELKQALLSGRLRDLTAPFMYHDPSKEIAFILMPLELNLRDTDQQRIIGQMTQSVMRDLPENAPRGYLLQPRMFYSFQSLVEAILEKDGITPEMLKAQQARGDLIRDLMRMVDPEQRRKMLRDNDALADNAFFEMIGASIEMNLEAGREAGAQQLSDVQKMAVEETTYGKVVGRRIEALTALQKTPTREVLLEQLVASDDPITRETLVAIGRQLIDYSFFQALTTRIDAADAAEKTRLLALRKEVQDVRDRFDASQKAYLDSKAALVNDILGAKDPLALARERAGEIDDAFFALLQANIQQAQQAKDEEMAKALSAVYSIGMQIVNESQPPEMQVISALMAAKYPDETEKLLLELKASGADARLVQIMGQLAEQLAREDRTEASAALTSVMMQASRILPPYDPNKDAGNDDGGAPPPPPPAEPPPTKPLIEIARR